MAKKFTVQIIDDLDGSVLDDDAGKTIVFSFEGRSYEIDLSDDNAAVFRKVLGPYIAAARQMANKSGSHRSTGSKSNSEELQVIRKWARANGIQVSDRGRIAATVREAYRKAQR